MSTDTGEGNTQHVASTDEYPLYTITCPDPIVHEIVVDGKPLSMEVDTGAGLSIISHDTFVKHWHNKTLRPSRDRLRTYTGEVIQVEGIADVGVQDRNRVIHTLPLVVVPGTEPSLLGRNWLTKVHVDWIAVHACRPTEHNSALNQTLRKHPVLFKDSREIAKTDM